MKTLLQFLLVQLCCLPLIATGALAKDNGRGDSKNKRSSSRPTVRPSQGASRNPITNSKASKPAARPQAKPAAKPQVKPAARPQTKPATRPQTKPAQRPNLPNTPQAKPGDRPNRPDAKPNKPDNRPNLPDAKPNKPDNRPNLPDRPNKPDTRPDNRPGNNRPDLNRPHKPETRPETKPGHVTYPRPGRPDAKPDRPGNNRPDINRPNRKPEVKPGKNTRPVKRPNFENNNIGNKNWWSNNRNSNNRTTIVNNKNVYRGGNKNVQINNNFKRNVNWSTNRRDWGYNPWWNRPATRPWYGGSWNCGWNRRYYNNHYYYHGRYWGGYRPLPGYVVYEDDHNDALEAIGWGLVGWSLGKMIFDTGYQTYTNPYPAQPVPSAKGSQVTYNQPITVVAAETAPPEDQTEKVTEVSESHIVSSQEAFKQRDYLKALDFANKAVGEAPGDGALHEYRALVLFALGKYSEAAGVLNPVLAGGPGWDWSTMITLYDSQDTYLNQLDALQKYSNSKPAAADAHFLLGYHQMVCGHLDQANAEFTEAAKLQPADSVSAQLRDLTAASSDNGDADDSEEQETPEQNTAEPPPPVPLEKLTGTWVADKGEQGTVTLALNDEGKFTWNYTKSGKSNEFGGEFSMNDSGLLVLDADESQMVASVELPQDNQLKFVLAGGPPGDPGLSFVKK